jgi:hypothetical protein
MAVRARRVNFDSIIAIAQRRYAMRAKMFTHADGTKVWWLDGRRHRTDGPAIEYTSGHNEWCIDGHTYTFDEWLEVNSNLTHEQKVIMKLQYG